MAQAGRADSNEPELRTASDIDRAFLPVMAQDDGPSKMADIDRRLDVDVNYASQYWLRLIAAELIHPARPCYVDFALPYLREHGPDTPDREDNEASMPWGCPGRAPETLSNVRSCECWGPGGHSPGLDHAGPRHRPRRRSETCSGSRSLSLRRRTTQLLGACYACTGDRPRRR